MEDDIALTFIILLTAMGLIVMFSLGYAFGRDDPSDIGKAKGVCEYKGGEMKDDICIVNGSVVDVKP